MITQPHTAFGWLLLALLVAAVAIVVLTRSPKCDGDMSKLAPFKAPALAVEFADSAAGVADIYKACHPRTLSLGLDQDDRIIIPLYVSLLSLVFALLFLCLPGWLPAPARIAALALGVVLVGAAAWNDGRENAALRDILNKTTDESGNPLTTGAPEKSDITNELRGLRRATTWKWNLFFAAFLLAGLMVLARGGWQSVVVALAYLLFAASGFFSLNARHFHRLELTFNVMGLPLVLTALWLAVPPPRAPGDAAPDNEKFAERTERASATDAP